MLHCVYPDMLGLVQCLLDLQVTFPIQVDGFHISKTVYAVRHSQQQQISGEERVLDNL